MCPFYGVFQGLPWSHFCSLYISFHKCIMGTDGKDYSNKTFAESGLLFLAEHWFLAHLDSPEKRIPLVSPWLLQAASAVCCTYSHG